MKWVKQVFILILFLVIAGCNQKQEYIYKEYDLSLDEELNGTSDIVDKYDTYQELTKSYNISTDYQEEYFIEKGLIVIYVGMSNDESIDEIKNLEVTNNELVVDITSSLKDSKDIKTILIFLELDHSKLSEINRIKIVKNQKNITKINQELFKTFHSFENLSYKFDGNVRIISSFDDFYSYNTQTEFELFENVSIDESYFNLNSVILVCFNSNTFLSNLTIDLSIVNNNLYINATSSQTGLDSNSIIGLIKISNNLLFGLENIRLIVDGKDITKNDEMLNFRYLSLTTYRDNAYNYNYRVIDTYEDLLKHTNNTEKLLEYYQDFDFKEKSLIIVRTASSTGIICSEMWYEIVDEELRIFSNILGQSPLASMDQQILCIEIDKDLLRKTNSIKQVVCHNNNLTIVNKNEYDAIHNGLYIREYFKSEFNNDTFNIIKTYDDLKEEIGDSKSLNYFSDYFEKGRVLIYFFEIPKNYRYWVSSYKVENNILYLECQYFELGYEELYDTKQYIIIDGLFEELDSVTDVELVYKEYQNNQ